MSKVIHEVTDWETDLKVSRLPNDGIKVRVSNGTPKGYLDVNLSETEATRLIQAIADHLGLNVE